MSQCEWEQLSVGYWMWVNIRNVSCELQIQPREEKAGGAKGVQKNTPTSVRDNIPAPLRQEEATSGRRKAEWIRVEKVKRLVAAFVCDSHKKILLDLQIHSEAEWAAERGGHPAVHPEVTASGEPPRNVAWQEFNNAENGPVNET